MEGWREGEEKKVSLLIVSERAQTLVVVGESGLACSGGMRQPRRGADAGNDSDDRFFFFSFFVFCFSSRRPCMRAAAAEAPSLRSGLLACNRISEN